jgi:hypothetical protein
VNPSRNWAHSTIGAPLEPTCWGSVIVNALERTRSPVDPVSTSTPSIVWQPADWPGSFGIVDTMRATGAGHVESTLISTAGDQYASMPSLHVAWATRS